MRFPHSLLLSRLMRWLLVLALLGGQLAGVAHALGHGLGHGREAYSGQTQPPTSEQKPTQHVCLDCLALSALGAALASDGVSLPSVDAAPVQTATAAELSTTLRRHHAPIRGPPLTL